MKIHYPGLGPAGSPELRLDQLEAIYRIKRELVEPGRSKAALVGAGMGSGKTVVTTEVIRHVKPKRALIVSVRDAYGQWAKCFKEQGVGVPLLRINGTETGMENFKKFVNGDDGVYYAGLKMLRSHDWGEVSETITHPDDLIAIFGGPKTEIQILRAHLMTYSKMKPVDLLVSDEAHKHANQKSDAGKTLATIKHKGFVALSRTFFGNKFENAWSLAIALWGKAIIGPKKTFEEDYCIKVPLVSKSGKAVTTPGGFPLTKIVSEKSPGEFVESLPCYVFIATPIGPVPEPEVVKVPLKPEQGRQYSEMEKQALTWIPTSLSAIREPLIADIPLTQRIRLRTAALGAMTLVPGADEDDPDSITFAPGCESSTLDELYNVLHRPSWKGKRALILTHSKPFAVEMARRIGKKYKVALKTGDTNPNKWEADKASFMEPVSGNSVQYLVAVISAVGTAMDGLQANCAKVVWVSEDESNVNNIQGSNRIWRDGVDLDAYEAVKIVQKGTIAEGVLKKNNTHRETTLTSVKGTS